MTHFVLEDDQHFLRYGGKEHVSVLKMRLIRGHSPHVKEHDWEFVETVGIGNQYKHQSLEIFGKVIQGNDLRRLACDLLQSRLLINREGYCYIESEIVPALSSTLATSPLSFSTIEYYRLNDLFGWSNYKVKPKITMIWNRREIESGDIIIDYEHGNNKGVINDKNGATKTVSTATVGKDDKQNNNNDSKVIKDYETRLKNLLVQMDALQRKLDSVVDLTKDGDSKNGSKSKGPPKPPPLPPFFNPIQRYTFKTVKLDEILRYPRQRTPNLFTFQIQSYNALKDSLSDAKYDEFESPEFGYDGHKWSLSIYLKGNPDENVTEHISLYLKKRTNNVIRGQNIMLLLRFYVFSFMNREYVAIQDLKVKEFDDQFQKRGGYHKALTIKDFESFSNGFLRNGKCIFGVELETVTSKPSTAQLNVINNLTFTWFPCIFDPYATLLKGTPPYESKPFIVDTQGSSYQWFLQIYPNGTGLKQNESFSVFLILVHDSNQTASGRNVFVDFEIKLKDKKDGTYHHKRKLAWFKDFIDSSKAERSHGFEDFIPLKLFNASDKYTLDDNVTFEVRFEKLFKLEYV